MILAPFLRILVEEIERFTAAFPAQGRILTETMGVCLSGGATLPPTAGEGEVSAPCVHRMVMQLLARVVERVQAEEER